MRFRTVLPLTTLFMLCFTDTVGSQPLDTHASLSGTSSASSTVAGKIAAVGDASFEVKVKKSQNAEAMQFMVDRNTWIAGELMLGAQAMVECRSEEGKNVAVHVFVTPTSRMVPFRNQTKKN